MRRVLPYTACALSLAVAGGCATASQPSSSAAEQRSPPADAVSAGASVAERADSPLAGTSWRLVRFQGGDGTALTPDDRSKYTLSFGGDGLVAARVDCNRGRSTWRSPEATQLRFGPLALTRAACPPGSLHDHIVKQWEYVRSYVLRDGHLFLSLMADGGIYEFEPMPEPTGSDR